MNKTQTIQDMMEKIVHRGPDASGVHIDDDIALGYHALSIIGSEEKDNPIIYNEDRTLLMAFDGEIYNYQALQALLTEKGHTFSTQGDSECILHLYEEYGSELLPRLRGVFAFVIYDTVKKTLFAARDFFGVKPFYYGQMNETFLFGSEIKSFFPHPDFDPQLNEEALAQYLTFQFSALPETFFKGIFKLLPGHYLTYKNNQLEIQQYFSPKFNPTNMTLETAVNDIDSITADAIEAHMAGDTEIGTFLSGGVDSSTLAARFKGQKAFTVGFDHKQYDEAAYARELANELGLEHYSKTITKDEYWASLPKVQYHMDEPLADPAAVAFYFACQEAAKHVKASFSGEGPDEFFGGYNIYREPLDLKILTRLPMFLRRLIGKLASLIPSNVKGKSFLIRGSKTVEERFFGNAHIFSAKERKAILKQDAGAPPHDITAPFYREAAAADDITKMQHLDIRLWLPEDILLNADKMSMAHSLIVRVPFVDKAVFNVAAKLPTDLRVNRNGTKYAFRQASAKHLPEAWAKRKKLGFPVPIRLWLREEKYYAMVKSYFTGTVAGKYFHTDVLIRLLDDHRANKNDNSRKIWAVLMFLIWHEEFFTA